MRRPRSRYGHPCPTHQRTVAALLYDFQASGDFVEAQVGPGFEVQTHKVSGAPAWPDTSVNQSDATRMGGTKVVLCEGAKLLVDGQLTNLLDGQSHWVPAGVDIARSGTPTTSSIKRAIV
jgi:hypothetical protein